MLESRISVLTKFIWKAKERKHLKHRDIGKIYKVTENSSEFVTRVDHPGMTQGILRKTGMGYRGTREELVQAQRCTRGVY